MINDIQVLHSIIAGACKLSDTMYIQRRDDKPYWRRPPIDILFISSWRWNSEPFTALRDAQASKYHALSTADSTYNVIGAAGTQVENQTRCVSLYHYTATLLRRKHELPHHATSSQQP